MYTLPETLQLAKAQLALGRQNETIHLTADQLNAVCYHLIDVDEAYTLLYREAPTLGDQVNVDFDMEDTNIDIASAMPKTWTQAMEEASASDDR